MSADLDSIHAIAADLLRRLDELRATPPDPRPLLTIDQLAARLGIGRTLAQELVDSGEIPVVAVTDRAIRIDSADVDSYVASKRARRG